MTLADGSWPVVPLLAETEPGGVLPLGGVEVDVEVGEPLPLGLGEFDGVGESDGVGEYDGLGEYEGLGETEGLPSRQCDSCR